MRKEVSKRLGRYAIGYTPREKSNELCNIPDCQHSRCFEKDGKWYLGQSSQPQEDELQSILMAAQIDELQKIRKILSFFQVVVIIGIVVGAIAAINLFLS